MGKGIIRVSTSVFEEREYPADQGGKYVPPALPQTLAEWHAFLMLPEAFHLLETRLDREDECWTLMVEHEAIPVVKNGKLPSVTAYMVLELNEDGATYTPYLDRVELNSYTPECKVIWQRSKE